MLLFSLFSFAQTNNWRNIIWKDFEKAKLSYEELLVNVPQNTQYFLRVIDCYQLQQFDMAEKALQTRIDKYHQEYYCWIRVQFSITKDSKAKEYYEQAIEKSGKNPNEVLLFLVHSKKKYYWNTLCNAMILPLICCQITVLTIKRFAVYDN
jgi:tetratricopeptide (TPR) repeat protein